MLRFFQGIKGNSHSLSTITQRKIDLKAKRADLHFNFKSINPAPNGLQWAWGRIGIQGRSCLREATWCYIQQRKKIEINIFKKPESTVKSFPRQANTSHLQPHPGAPSVCVCRGWQWRAGQRSASAQRSRWALSQWFTIVCSSRHPTILARQSACNPGNKGL